MRRYIFIALGILTLSVAALGDAGGKWIIHEDIKPGGNYSEHPTIRMAAEDVNIVLHNDEAEVKAVFEFENTGEACSVEMVFPLDGALHPAEGWEALNKKYPDVDWYHGEKMLLDEEEVIVDFDVTLDGSAADYSLTELAPSGVETIRGYAVWSVDFAAGEKRIVECTYTSDYGGGGAMQVYNDFGYVLFTGASWKGPIGYGKVTIKPGNDFADGWQRRFLLYDGFTLPPAKDNGNSVVWEFHDFEPVKEGYPTGISKICVYLIYDPVIKYEWYDYSGYGIEEGPGAHGIIRAEKGINFRTKPDNTSIRVPGHEFLPKGEPVAVLEREGDWYRVRTIGGFEGWVRWRYVDPDTGKENRYIEIYLSEA